MTLPPSDLLAGEQWITSKRANVVIRLDDYGLSRFAFDPYLGMMGMQCQEAIGGRLHLTTFRLLFQAHSVNRLAGKFSIFLPTLRAVRDTSRLFVRQVTVDTQTQRYDFIVWGIPAFLQAIEAACGRLDQATIAALQTAAINEYAKCGDGLQIQQAFEAMNISIFTAQTIIKLVNVASHPFELCSVLNLLELFTS